MGATTRSGLKRKAAGHAASSEQVVRTTKKIRVPPPRPSAAVPGSSTAHSKAAPTKSGQALSVAPDRPINVNQVHTVRNLHLFQALNLRSIVEQTHRHSMTLVRNHVVRRLQRMTSLVNDDKKYVSNDRTLRKLSRFVQETLGYLAYYTDQDDNDDDAMDNDKIQLNIYTAGLETIVAILDAAEHFRQTIAADFGWHILIGLLRRHTVRLRGLVCQVLMACFVYGPTVVDQPSRLTASDRNWNSALVERLVRDNDSWSVIFSNDYTAWGLRANRKTMILLNQFCRCVISNLETRDRYIALLRDTVLPLCEQYLAHADLIMERLDELQRTLETLIQERTQLGEDMQRAHNSISQLITVTDRATLTRMRRTAEELAARSDALEARANANRAAMALLR